MFWKIKQTHSGTLKTNFSINFHGLESTLPDAWNVHPMEIKLQATEKVEVGQLATKKKVFWRLALESNHYTILLNIVC